MSNVLAVTSDRALVLLPQLLAVQSDDLTPLTITADADTLALFGAGASLWMDIRRSDGTDVFVGPYPLAASISVIIPASAISVAGSLQLQVRIEDDAGRKWQSLRTRAILPPAIDSEVPATPADAQYVRLPTEDPETGEFLAYDPANRRVVGSGHTHASFDPSGAAASAEAAAKAASDPAGSAAAAEAAAKAASDPVGTAATAVSGHDSSASPHSGKFDIAGAAESAVSGHNGAASAHGLNDAATIGAFPIPDAGGYYGVDTIDGALQAVGASLALSRRYGVYKSFGSAASTLTRLGGAAGRTFLPQVGTLAGANDFESIRPWSEIRLCNLSDLGVVNAYAGEPGYVLDGTNGQCMVEIPKYYYKVAKSGDGWEWWISADPATGFTVHPAFVAGGGEKPKIYVASYLGAEVASKLVSVTTVLPAYNYTRAQFRTKARARGTGWGIVDFTTWSALQLLMMVAVGNFDVQTAVGRGICDMRYAATDTATVAESSVNRIIVTNAVSAYFLAGNMIGIGTSLGGNQIAMYRQITSVDVYDASNKAITFDGAPVNVAVGNIVYVMPSKTGGADALGIHTGRATGTDGKTEVGFFGMQGLWGNFFQFLDGWNMDASYYPWLNDNPATYADDTFASPYVRYEGVMPSAADGYIQRFAYDAARPWAMLPSEVGGASSGPVGDYVYRTTAGNRVLLVGGYWYAGSIDGPWNWLLNYASSTALWSSGARLLYKPG